MCEVRRHCFDFYREIPNSVIEVAKEEIYLNRNLIEEFGNDDIHPEFNRALCEQKIDECYKVLNLRLRKLITDWEAIAEIVDIHKRKE